MRDRSPGEMRDRPQLRGDDELSRSLLDRVNTTGRFFLSSTRINDRFHLRLNATNHRIRAAHLDDALALIAACARRRDHC
jgi:aromatic-L-amino-acid decarboxylase